MKHPPATIHRAGRENVMSGASPFLAGGLNCPDAGSVIGARFVFVSPWRGRRLPMRHKVCSHFSTLGHHRRAMHAADHRHGPEGQRQSVGIPGLELLE